MVKKVVEETTVYNISPTKIAQIGKPMNELVKEIQELTSQMRDTAKDMAENVPTAERQRQDEIMNAETSTPSESEI